jgi:NAD(P)-dependent dehydrogenase (short-subunit alcohol dehydrogenase family)
MENPFTLKDKQILITGASSGIGRAVAIECSKSEANLIISGRNSENLNETYSLLNGKNHNVLTADMNFESEISNLVDKLPILNGIVHCSGINTKSLVKFLNEDKINSVMKTNFNAPALLMKDLIKQKKLQKNASIIMISSIASTYAAISNTVYASSKGALNSLVRVLALELAAQNIRVNGIQPGMIRTGILNAYDLQENLKEYEKEYPLGRLGNPKDVAFAAIYLLSDVSGWITGTSLIVDGGISLR